MPTDEDKNFGGDDLEKLFNSALYKHRKAAADGLIVICLMTFLINPKTESEALSVLKSPRFSFK